MSADAGVDAALLSPSLTANAALNANRQRAMRLFDIGYVVDADQDPDNAIDMPAGRQVRF